MKTLIVLLFRGLAIFCLSEGGNAQTLFSKLPLFYQWAYPRKFSSAIYTEVYDSQLVPKKYNFSSTDDLLKASEDAMNPLGGGELPRIFELNHDPIDSSIGWGMLSEPGYLEMTEQRLESISKEIQSLKNSLSRNERIIARRDLWRVIADLRIYGRLVTDVPKGFKATVKDLQHQLIESYDSLQTNDVSQAALKASPTLIDTISSLSDESARDYLSHLQGSAGFKEVPFVPFWEHNLAYPASSVFKIWISDDQKGKKFVILMRYSIAPLSSNVLLFFPTGLIEEVFVCGVGDNPPFAPGTGLQPWRMHFAFDREKFLIATLKDGSDRLWTSYVAGRNMDGPAYIGFSSDAINNVRGGRSIVTERISCIECHGDVLGEKDLGLQHQRSYKAAGDRLFDMVVTDEGDYKYAERKLSTE